MDLKKGGHATWGAWGGERGIGGAYDQGALLTCMTLSKNEKYSKKKKKKKEYQATLGYKNPSKEKESYRNLKEN